MTQQNALLDKHRDEAAKAAGFDDLREAGSVNYTGGPMLRSILAHAQTLANLEAANNRLAEIDRIARERGWTEWQPLTAEGKVAALASGHTPSPCPHCAAKDEAMAERAREVSEALTEYFKDAPGFIGQLDRFIIPPADPVADALREALTGANLLTDSELVEHFAEVFAEHGLEIAELKSRLPLGGAK